MYPKDVRELYAALYKIALEKAAALFGSQK